MMSSCTHGRAKWKAMPSARLENGTDDCFYELHCDYCGISLKQRTYAPGTVEPFYLPAINVNWFDLCATPLGDE